MRRPAMRRRRCSRASSSAKRSSPSRALSSPRRSSTTTAGHLTAHEAASGGPKLLSGQDFYFGINDVVSGDYRSGALFDAERISPLRRMGARQAQRRRSRRRASRRCPRAVARGQSAVQHQADRHHRRQAGSTTISASRRSTGTCTTCHDTPNAGNHSIPAPLDIGLADASRRTPDLPLYTLRNRRHAADSPDDRSGPRADHRQVEGHRPLQGADPARARGARAVLPQRLRTRSARRSSTSTTTRFGIGLTDQEKRDLVAFLRAL